MAKPRVRIAVLAGGRGSRLGGAKPATLLAGRPIIEHVLAAARATDLPVLVVAKASSALPHLEAEVALEPERPRHPLAGVLAALRALPAQDPGEAVLAVGCDMPFLTAPLLRELAGIEGAAAVRTSGYLQPLPARYPLGALVSLEHSLSAQLSLRDALGALTPVVLEEPELTPYGDPQRLCFSVNDASDLKTAQAWLAERP